MREVELAVRVGVAARPARALCRRARRTRPSAVSSPRFPLRQPTSHPKDEGGTPIALRTGEPDDAQGDPPPARLPDTSTREQTTARAHGAAPTTAVGLVPLWPTARSPCWSRMLHGSPALNRLRATSPPATPRCSGSSASRLAQPRTATLLLATDHPGRALDLVPGRQPRSPATRTCAPALTAERSVHGAAGPARCPAPSTGHPLPASRSSPVPARDRYVDPQDAARSSGSLANELARMPAAAAVGVPLSVLRQRLSARHRRADRLATREEPRLVA